ncbi:hypothetical protein [Eisenbergiella sp.]
MRKKQWTALILMCLALLLTACGGQEGGKETVAEEPLKIETEGGNTGKEKTEPQPAGAENSAGGTESREAEGKNPSTDTGDGEVTGRFEIFEVTQDGLLAYGIDNTYPGLCSIGHGNILANQDGETIELSALVPGLVVELTWNGAVEESYPAQFSYSALKLTGESGNPEFLLYLQLLQDLAKTDPGLNEGITESYFDFTSVASLSEGEKEGLAYLGGTYFGGFGSQSTQEELATQGILDREKGIENGILVTIEELSNQNGKVTCNAEKYRSGTGAYYFHDVTAEYKDGEWKYEIGAEMIS